MNVKGGDTNLGGDKALCLSLLKKYWGYDSFRGSQQEVIDQILRGEDTLVLMPTGGGKSICFQLPALIKEGVCIVISPLIALINDQVNNLRKRGIIASAIHSGLSPKAIDIALDNAIFGKTKFLYLSPERLESRLFRARLSKMKINYLIVDEAHCISQWGYDFRPSYLNIKSIKEIIGESVPTIALTATAPSEVAKDIMLQLQFKSEKIISASFERENLSFVVKQTENKIEYLIRSCKKMQDSSVIVYCRERKRCEEVASILKHSGLNAEYYHAGLDKIEREKRQALWTKGAIKIMVSTNAFGMGIDKPDVRLVIHCDLPDSIEAYYQEAGRAGRDGLKSWAVIFWNAHDIKKTRDIITSSFPSFDSLSIVYQSIYHYLKIAFGEGRGIVKYFDIQKFAKRYNFSVVASYHAIKYLEQEGFWEVTDSINNPSKILFLISRDALYREHFLNGALENFVNSLMRLYSGLFTQTTPIDEEYIAKKTVDSVANVEAKLKELNRLKIIKYIPRKVSPLIFILKDRARENEFSISNHRYEIRKQQLTTRLEALFEYIQQTDICRSRFLINYFDQPSTHNCGICDICLKESHTQQSKSERSEANSKIKKAITDYISEQNKNGAKVGFSDIQSISQLGEEKQYLFLLEEMINDGIVKVEDNCLYIR